MTEFGWVYKYPEKKDVKSGNPWVIRHTGIYQIHNKKGSRSTLLIVNPSPNALFGNYLRKRLQQDLKPACTALEEPLVTFDTLKEVRAIEKRILPAEPLLTALDELIRDLEQAGDHLLEANDGNKDARVAVHQSLEELRKEALS
ncbi:unnamed protein product [Alternaria alternata]